MPRAKPSVKTKPSAKAAPRKRRALPGDPVLKDLVERMIRVDHAGEYGAKQIYKGQLRILKNHRTGPTIEHMAEQEEEHLAVFEDLVRERRVRPTVLQPLWHVAGYALGAGTAMLGPKAAMACTVAVEEVIVEHYTRQIEKLGNDDPDLAKILKKFRDEEDEHRETGLEHEAATLPYYKALRRLIRTGSKAAIWLSERV